MAESVSEPTDLQLYFFYNRLSHPDMLRHVLSLEKRPTLVPAFIVSYKIQYWLACPCLIRDEDDPTSKVNGYAWWGPRSYHPLLKEDMIPNFDPHTTTVHIEGKEVLGHTAIYNGIHEGLFSDPDIAMGRFY
ncbi:unnamed protein product [Somion occarium]|uniref:Uncharacterized protein n=1 Tax=Somion occarium TaxID=3059160 RepID=A0ABP1DVD4_9APHY